ncbi:MAG: GYD domain-containing protein [Chloroflexota bacterium]|nr:GYD domain-containing protein [Chloroflexota bacterium]
MPKYLAKASYSVEGLKGLINEGGTSRKNAITEAIGSVGGTVESLYFAFGEDDLYVIFEVPERANATALGMSIASAGAISWSTTALLTPEEIDAAASIPVNYRPPNA